MNSTRNMVTATRKRKDREDMMFYNQPHKGNFGISKPHQQPSSANNTKTNTTSFLSPSSSQSQSQSPGSNRLLAGYMAHEFLTRGTLFGQKFDPARAEAVPLAAADSKRRMMQTGFEPEKPGPVSRVPGYAEVAQLLKTDGAHIQGVVNPTQLARWIQM